MTESEALNMIQAKLTCMELYDLSCIEKSCDRKCENCEYNYAQGNNGEQKEALKVAIQALEKTDKTEITLIKRRFATEIKQLVHQKCIEINHYVSGCNSPFNYLQIADVQESLREIENTLNIKIKE